MRPNRDNHSPFLTDHAYGNAAVAAERPNQVAHILNAPETEILGANPYSPNNPAPGSIEEALRTPADANLERLESVEAGSGVEAGMALGAIARIMIWNRNRKIQNIEGEVAEKERHDDVARFVGRSILLGKSYLRKVDEDRAGTTPAVDEDYAWSSRQGLGYEQQLARLRPTKRSERKTAKILEEITHKRRKEQAVASHLAAPIDPKKSRKSPIDLASPDATLMEKINTGVDRHIGPKRIRTGNVGVHSRIEDELHHLDHAFIDTVKKPAREIAGLKEKRLELHRRNLATVEKARKKAEEKAAKQAAREEERDTGTDIL